MQLIFSFDTLKCFLILKKCIYIQYLLTLLSFFLDTKSIGIHAL